MSLPEVAFLGIGLMGKPMAARVAQAGYPLSVWNRTPDKARELGAHGAAVHAHVVDAVRAAQVVVSMLADGDAVAQVMRLALPAMPKGALWIDMSSTRHDEALSFAATLGQHEQRFLDAPVSGGVGGAEAGTLAIMAGGSAGDFDEAAPLLRVLGSPMLVGPAGSGQVAKLCNQLIVGGTLNIVAEALLLAQAAGADPAAVREAIRGGFAGSRILDVHGQRMLERTVVAGGQVSSQLKDLHNVLAASGKAQLMLPVTELVTRQYESIAGDHSRADHAAALLALERINSGERLGSGEDKL